MLRVPARRTGFTLVELLVVIGIIALLVSILLPSLAKARMAANQVACAANLKSMGSALSIYESQFRKLPYGTSVVAFPGNTPYLYGPAWVYTWAGEASRIMGVKPESGWPVNANGTLSATGWTQLPSLAKIFRCPDAPPDLSTPTPVPWGLSYCANPRILPDNLQVDWANPANSANPPPNPLIIMHTRSSGDIKDAAEKIMVFDAGVNFTSDYNYSSFMTAALLDQYLLTWGANWPAFVYDENPSLAGNVPGLNQLMPPGNAPVVTVADVMANNTENGGWSGTPVPTWENAMRYRHMNNMNMNALFVDGHVESLRIGSVTWRQMCVNWK